MRYLALAWTNDGTLAGDEGVTRGTLEALERLRLSGRRAILVTGRLLDAGARGASPQAARTGSRNALSVMLAAS